MKKFSNLLAFTLAGAMIAAGAITLLLERLIHPAKPTAFAFARFEDPRYLIQSVLSTFITAVVVYATVYFTAKRAPVLPYKKEFPQKVATFGALAGIAATLGFALFF